MAKRSAILFSLFIAFAGLNAHAAETQNNILCSPSSNKILDLKKFADSLCLEGDQYGICRQNETVVVDEKTKKETVIENFNAPLKGSLQTLVAPLQKGKQVIRLTEDGQIERFNTETGLLETRALPSFLKSKIKSAEFSDKQTLTFASDNAGKNISLNIDSLFKSPRTEQLSPSNEPDFSEAADFLNRQLGENIPSTPKLLPKCSQLRKQLKNLLNHDCIEDSREEGGVSAGVSDEKRTHHQSALDTDTANESDINNSYLPEIYPVGSDSRSKKQTILPPALAPGFESDSLTYLEDLSSDQLTSSSNMETASGENVLDASSSAMNDTLSNAMSLLENNSKTTEISHENNPTEIALTETHATASENLIELTSTNDLDSKILKMTSALVRNSILPTVTQRMNWSLLPLDPVKRTSAGWKLRKDGILVPVKTSKNNHGSDSTKPLLDLPELHPAIIPNRKIHFTKG